VPLPTRAELVAAHARVQAQLTADGWRRGRYEYTTPEQQALHGGMTSRRRILLAEGRHAESHEDLRF
jgi:hypothetical protein